MGTPLLRGAVSSGRGWLEVWVNQIPCEGCSTLTDALNSDVGKIIWSLSLKEGTNGAFSGS